MERSRPWVLLALAVVYFCVVTATAYYKRNGLSDLRELNAAIERIDREIAGQRRKQERYRHELAMLRSGDAYVEAVARESLGLVKPGEVVYEFVDAETLVGGDRSIRPPEGK